MSFLPSGDYSFEGLHYRYLTDDAATAGAPAVLMLHSLSANAHVFDGLLNAGLGAGLRLVIPNLPGRGESAKTRVDYSLEGQSALLVRLLDSLGIARVTVMGHSFGGFLGMYLSAHYPTRVERLVLLDSAPVLNPFTPLMVAALVDRTVQVYPSFDAYLVKVKMSPFLQFWDNAMTPYHRADVDELPGGVVMPKPKLPVIAALVAHLPTHNWRVIAARVRQPVLVVAATDAFIAGHPVLPPDAVRISVGMIPRAEAAWVAGNHQTMLYREGAAQIVARVREAIGLAQGDSGVEPVVQEVLCA